MSLNKFSASLKKELQRLDRAGTAKRREIIISGFTKKDRLAPRAVIAGRKYQIFNSNDYLGLRLDSRLQSAEHRAAKKFGTGPGAVRFISGTLVLHRDLETAIARFHHREDALIFSSAFTANLACISCLVKGQSKDSLVSSQTLVLSDELNHRSIVDGIRLANLPAENRLVFHHLDYTHLSTLLAENRDKYTRVIIVSDGVFSMLGEIADLTKMRTISEQYDSAYPEGVLLYIDDAHGIGVLGKSGRGTEEHCQVQADVLIGTLGKAFGCDGGYVAGSQVLIDYLRESAATYIYSNSLSPGTAGAALEALSVVDSHQGRQLLSRLQANITDFRRLLSRSALRFAADSRHAIQPLLMGDPAKALAFRQAMFKSGMLVTNINYPVVPPGRDEIRIQLSAAHTPADLESLAAVAIKNFSP
jgi:glycine C-acetyltransferase